MNRIAANRHDLICVNKYSPRTHLGMLLGYITRYWLFLAGIPLWGGREFCCLDENHYNLLASGLKMFFIGYNLCVHSPWCIFIYKLVQLFSDHRKTPDVKNTLGEWLALLFTCVLRLWTVHTIQELVRMKLYTVVHRNIAAYMFWPLLFY